MIDGSKVCDQCNANLLLDWQQGPILVYYHKGDGPAEQVSVLGPNRLPDQLQQLNAVTSGWVQS